MGDDALQFRWYYAVTDAFDGSVGDDDWQFICYYAVTTAFDRSLGAW